MRRRTGRPTRLTTPDARARRPRRTAAATPAAQRSRAAASPAPPQRPLPRTVAGLSLRRTTLTGRAAVLGIAVCMLVLTLAYPLRSYLSQRSQINGIAAQNSQDRAQVSALQAQVDHYKDSSYVEQQARIRLHYQFPGDKTYLLPPAAPAAPVRTRAGHATVQVAPEKAWYDQLWGSAAQAAKE